MDTPEEVANRLAEEKQAAVRVLVVINDITAQEAATLFTLFEDGNINSALPESTEYLLKQHLHYKDQ